MSTLVETINDAIKARVAAVLGGSYSELDYVLDVAQNSFKSESLRYGVRPLSSNLVPGTLRTITKDQTFQIILTDPYANRAKDDTAQRVVTFVQLDKMDDIVADLMHTKAGVPDIILLIHDPSTEEPEYIEGDNIAVLRENIIIRYRRSTT